MNGRKHNLVDVSFVDDVVEPITASADVIVAKTAAVARAVYNVFMTYAMPLNFSHGKSEAVVQLRGKGKKDGTKKKKAKKGGREGTRSGGLDAELLAASGIQPEGVDVRSLQEGGRDYVMQRLGETINRMKDNFIVAHLNWEGQSEENMVVPKDIMEYRKRHGIEALPCSSSEEAKVKVEDSFEVYQKEVFERHQAEDAQDYVRKVLLEDIMYYRATNQDKKILQMEKVAEGEQGSVEKMRSLLAAKRAQKGSVTTTSLRDTSQGPSRSNDYLLDTTSMKKSNHYRPGA